MNIQKKKMTFDDLLENRIHLGVSQIKAFLILSMIDFMAGFQEVFMAILLSILKASYDLDQDEIDWLSSSFFIGVMIGNCVCAYCSDIFGRKKLLVSTAFGSVVVTVITAYLEYNFYLMLALRTLYGIIFGTIMPISQIMVSEIVPKSKRGMFIVLLQFIYIIGILYLIGSCFIFLDDFEHGDWRMLLGINAIPALICFIGSILILNETPRYFLSKGDYENAYKEINRMIIQNKPSNGLLAELTEDEKIALKAATVESSERASVVDLFKKDNLRASISLWIIFFVFNLYTTGIFLLMPFLYQSSNNSFLPMLIAYGSELPAILLVSVLIDNRSFGRIRLIILGCLLMAIFLLLLFFFEESVVVVSMVVCRFSIRIAWSCLNALPAESYKTFLRSMGVGMAQGIGKVGGTLTPFIIFPIFFKWEFLPFLIFAGCSIVTGIVVFFHPIDLTDKPLDDPEQDGQPYKSSSQSNYVAQQDEKDSSCNNVHVKPSKVQVSNSEDYQK